MPLNGWQTALAVTGGVVGGAALLWPLGIWWEVGKCERPKHAVIRALASTAAARRRFGLGWGQAAELRRYAPMLVAEVEVTGTMKESSSAGFRKIAGFIFGKNSGAGGGGGSEAVAMTSPVVMEMKGPGEKVAMTSPVVMEMAGTEQLPAEERGAVRMAFVMPSKYTAATLPRPTDASVQIKEVPGYCVASLSFRGHVRGRRTVEQRKHQLLSIMEAEGLKPQGNLILLQYHPPFTYGWQRVNEVQFRVQEPAEGQE